MVVEVREDAGPRRALPRDPRRPGTELGAGIGAAVRDAMESGMGEVVALAHDGGRSRSHGRLELLCRKGVQDLAPPDPPPPRHVDSPAEVGQTSGRVRVARDHERNAAAARLADPAWLQIQPVWIA